MSRKRGRWVCNGAKAHPSSLPSREPEVSPRFQSLRRAAPVGWLIKPCENGPQAVLGQGSGLSGLRGGVWRSCWWTGVHASACILAPRGTAREKGPGVLMGAPRTPETQALCLGIRAQASSGGRPSSWGPGNAHCTGRARATGKSKPHGGRGALLPCICRLCVSPDRLRDVDSECLLRGHHRLSGSPVHP